MNGTMNALHDTDSVLKAIQFIGFAHDGRVSLRGHVQDVGRCTLLVADPEATAESDRSGGVFVHRYTTGELHALRRDLCELALPACNKQFRLASVYALPMSSEMGQAAACLGAAEPRSLLRFLWLYGLGMDRAYFEGLLVHAVDSQREFFEFVEQHSLMAWPVAHYATRLGLSVHKLNVLFEEKFGMSAKRWLLERRLARACELLVRTSLSVTEVALQCGFNTHAHFTETFKKRYKKCPRAMRQLV